MVVLQHRQVILTKFYTSQAEHSINKHCYWWLLASTSWTFWRKHYGITHQSTTKHQPFLTTNKLSTDQLSLPQLLHHPSTLSGVLSGPSGRVHVRECVVEVIEMQVDALAVTPALLATQQLWLGELQWQHSGSWWLGWASNTNASPRAPKQHGQLILNLRIAIYQLIFHHVCVLTLNDDHSMSLIIRCSINKQLFVFG